MKKLFISLLMAFSLLFTASLAKADDFDAPAKHAIAVEATTGKILYEKDASTPDGVASMTKILTVYMVYKAIDEGKLSWNSKVKISDYAYDLTTNYEASNVPMDAREYTVKELVNAALIASANSAAIALAEKLGGDEAAKALIEEIAADIIPIDGLIAFAGSEDGKKIFGAEKAAGIEAHAKKIKAEGARFCDCPACTAVAAILADKADLYAPTYSLTWTVTDDMTAKRIGSAGSKILSTPNMVALMEDAALELAKSYLEEGQTTVGAEIHCRHLAPTPVGMKVTATAKLRSIERRKLWFDIEVNDEKGKCGEGSHLRVIVNSKAMSEKAEKKAE